MSSHFASNLLIVIRLVSLNLSADSAVDVQRQEAPKDVSFYKKDRKVELEIEQFGELSRSKDVDTQHHYYLEDDISHTWLGLCKTPPILWQDYHIGELHEQYCQEQFHIDKLNNNSPCSITW